MDSSPAKPSRIGAYDIIDVIGRGGMGTVFRGNDPRIGRAVAIKVLTAAAEDPDLLIRFYREAKYTGSLHHQNIVTVYELGHQDGVPYLVMEYLEGVSLEAVIASGKPMPVAEKLGIILQVCSGLTYAHKQSLVHRDIKPANIMILEDGTAKIVDFGIALLGGSRLTRTGHVVGSLNYMSPEQLSGNVEVDVRSDVYSTGVVLFQLLTGVLPFDGGSTAATLRKIVQDPPPPLSKYLQDCPEELEAILQKALVKNREERYPSPEDFALDLARVHAQYLKKMLGETLQQATEAVRRKDFVTARQQVLQVLRGAPQNNEAADLLKQIKQGLEQQHHEQQVLQWQMKAEESFRKNHLEEALQCVEQGMRLDPGGAVFAGLRDAIVAAQARMGKYREALQRAEAALRCGDLEAAKQSVEAAQAILPDDPGARTLAGQIITRLEAQLRDQKAGEKQRQFARSVNAAEKAMADARMLLLLGQVPETLQALGNMETEVRQLPPRWVEQFEALKKEALAKKKEQERPAPQIFDGQTAEIPAASSATVVLQAGAADAPPAPGDTGSVPQPVTGTGRFATPDRAHDILYPRAERRVSEKAEVAPELREFLQPEPSTWFSRPTVWLGVAVLVLVLVLVGVFMWLFVRPGSESQARARGQGAVAGYTYAEINAEPWATVTAVAPASGDAPSIVGQQTPLRVKLPPGPYTVTLQGPNHEEKQVGITVPQSGGASCFAVFRKPDLNRIVGKDKD
jgi:serine/threonine protein kinase